MKKIKNGTDEEYEWSLTDEEIRAEKGFENATDEDIQLLRQTFALLSLAFFESELNSNHVYRAVKKFIFYQDDPEHSKYLELHRSDALKYWRQKKLKRIVQT